MEHGVAAGKKHRRALRDVAFDALGTSWCGNTHPPCDHRTVRFTEDGSNKVVSVLNDGFSLYLGYLDEWKFHLRRENAWKLARFIIGWRVSEWFGLRRWLWYRLLRRRVSRLHL